MKTIIFATHNKNKLAELRAILPSDLVKVVSLDELGYHDEIIEDGVDLVQNAWIKADSIYEKMGGNVLAEDTGLEVDALRGAPGVHSARYAGDQRNNSDNIDKLLTNLQGQSNREAQFRTVLALWFEGEKISFEGIVRGRITTSRQGTGGFGYDPVFQPDGYNKTFGELDSSLKNKISHRGKALEKFAGFIKFYD